jgi:diacylglycerol kinase family enzyme
VLIANPAAGRGKVARMLPEVERRLRAEGLAHRIVRTRGRGHATQAAREALLGGERFVVAARGNGTVHEAVNGMVDRDRPVAEGAVLGVMACGSGCDFARTFVLPGDAVRASARLGGGATRAIDIGKVAFAGRGGPPTARYFAHIAEVWIRMPGGDECARAKATLAPFGGPARPSVEPRVVT